MQGTNDVLLGKTVESILVHTDGTVSFSTDDGEQYKIVQNDSSIVRISGGNIRHSPIVFTDIEYMYEEEECGGYIETFVFVAENGNKLEIEYASWDYGCTYYNPNAKGTEFKHVYA